MWLLVLNCLALPQESKIHIHIFISLLKTNLDMGGTFSDPVNDFICMTAFNVFAVWNFAVTNLENLTYLSTIAKVKHRAFSRDLEVGYRLHVILI